MDRGTLEKVVEKLQGRADIEILERGQERKGILYRLGMKMAGRSVNPEVYYTKVKEDGKKKKLIVVKKDDATKEYENIKDIHKEITSDCKLRLPTPKLIFSEDNIVVTEEVAGCSLSELLFIRNLFLGPRQEELERFMENLGKGLSAFHNSTASKDKINISDKIREVIEDIEDVLPKRIKDKLEEIELEPVMVPETYIHGDTTMRNIIWNGKEPGLIDWADSSYGCPLDDINYLQNCLYKRDRTCFRTDLKRLGEIFKESYKDSVKFETSNHIITTSKLKFLLQKIKRKPSKIEENFYKKQIISAIDSLNLD